MSDQWRNVKGHLFRVEGSGATVAILESEDEHGDTFFYVGEVKSTKDYGHLLRTRDEAYAMAERRFGKLDR